jgi:hypothetical protein
LVQSVVQSSGPLRWSTRTWQPFLLKSLTGPGAITADFRGPKIVNDFWPERARYREKTHFGGGETLIIFRPLNADINAELLIDE